MFFLCDRKHLRHQRPFTRSHRLDCQGRGYFAARSCPAMPVFVGACPRSFLPLCGCIGWLMHRIPGGLVAGTLFILPGYISLMLLSWLYAAYGEIGPVQALFFGLKAAVLAIVVEAVFKVGKRALKNRVMIGLA